MSVRPLPLFGLLLTLTASLAASPPAHAESPPALQGQRGLVTADNALASAVGAQILRDGGDAIDAAVACALALGVVAPFASGIGGGGFALVHRAQDGEAYALDFREVAPAEAHADMYLDAQGEPIPKASQKGARAAAVPGEIAGLAALHKAHGRLPWAQVVAPAERLAREGFAATALLRRRLSPSCPEALAADLCPDGAPPEVGRWLRRPQLAATLAQIAEAGPQSFYEGPLAARIAQATQAAGGLISAEDLRRYRPKRREVLRTPWRGLEVLSMPPPSSGGALLIQTLLALEDLPQSADWPAQDHNSSAYLHRLTEAFKHGFADRARVMGDPDFVPVPVADMLSPEAIARVRAAFDPQKTLSPEAYGQPFDLPEDGGTSHLNVIDAQGNAVALTTTVNTGFGSEAVAGDTGVLLNNEMDDFIVRPGVPNAFGLVGRKANAIEPLKRPLSSMSPTLVRQDGQVILAVGASGGPTIITATAQVLLNVLHFQLDPQAAVDEPRVHHQWQPNLLWIDPLLPADVRIGLEARGHQLQLRPRFTAAQVILRDPRSGLLRGASDPSKLGLPAREEDQPAAAQRDGGQTQEGGAEKGGAEKSGAEKGEPARLEKLRAPTLRTPPRPLPSPQKLPVGR